MIRAVGQIDLLSPPELGRRYGFAPETIIGWINAKELKAANTTVKPGGRPRWRVKIDDFEQFLLRRSNIATAKPPRTRRKSQPANVIEFY